MTSKIDLNQQGVDVSTDVLVIGGGLAGSWAALRAASSGAKVTLVEMAKLARQMKSTFSGATILYPTSKDDLDAWAKEIVEAGSYVNDQDWVVAILQETESRVRDMEEWGTPFERDKDGQLVRKIGMGHQLTRGAWVEGEAMMKILKKRLEAAKVEFLERTMITNLLTSDGCYPTTGSVVGAVGFNTKTAEPVTIRARATVMTSGAMAQEAGLTGDGIAQAFRAGAQLKGMEFSETFTHTVGPHYNTLARVGIILRNSKGERFMPSYYPEKKEQVGHGPRAIACMIEEMEGRGPIYGDLTHLSAEDLNTLRSFVPVARWIQTMQDEEGIDVIHQQYETGHTAAGFPSLRSGGIRSSIYGEASLPGLYTAGEAAGQPTHGTYSVGGVNLATCCVGGYRAGESAARYAREGPSFKAKQEQVDKLREDTFLPLKRTGGIKPDSCYDQFDRLLSPADVSIFRTQKSLTAILSRIEAWQEIVPSLVAEDVRSLLWANKVPNLILCAKLAYTASLAREECRGNNLRADFPYRDDINWLKWVILKQEGEGDDISVTEFPLPIYRWPVKPARYEQIPVPYPMPKAQEWKGE